ncbi:pentapeptide repeat-containing protein [uncultured Hoeflea sp.]|uniref:pentapeptide repeat-containing protein n=1 Tax=uncultured Hoeflea sp. TaxID=538666 RepID=UPI00260CF5F6|nr:pentapeptide repeat-containing protein [uncultured Hoeflea sp.]
MAEPPKRPSRRKPKAEPDFSPFEDWLIDGPAGEWPEPWQTDEELSPEQKQIVAANAALLLDRQAWFEKAAAFEAAIEALADEAQQREARANHHTHFDRHMFADGPKNFLNLPFPCAVSFSGASFGEGDVLFNRVSFGEGDVSFDEASFGEGIVSFSEASFGEGAVLFSGASFGKGTVLFSEASFGEGDVSFYGASFGEGAVLFSGASFGEGDVSFDEASFGEGAVSFDGASFGDGAVSFDGASFGDGTVSFDEASFGDGTVRFDEARFGKGTVSFAGTTFGEGDVRFDGASFGEGDVSFNGASFGNGDVSFFRTRFGDGDVLFDRAHFKDGNVFFDEVDFRLGTIFASDMVVAGSLYVRSQFQMKVFFRRLDVKGTASFSGSGFAEVPDFCDAKFDRPPEVAGMEVPRPRLGHGGDRGKLSPLSRALFSTALDPDDVAKYRKLKAMALAANDHEKDGEFFAGEMLAKRGVETTSFAGLLFNTFYWKLSDFGQSFTLPLKWMGGLILVFAAINVAVVQIGAPSTLATIPSRFEAIVFSVVLSLKNAVPLLGSLFRFASAPDEHKGWFQTYYDTLKQHTATVDWLIGLGVAQSILGGVLLFLFLLALRNKFRLK